VPVGIGLWLSVWLWVWSGSRCAPALLVAVGAVQQAQPELTTARSRTSRAGRTTVGFPAGGVRKLRASTTGRAVRPSTPAIAASRHAAHRRAIDFTRKTQEIFVITDVSWQFS